MLAKEATLTFWMDGKLNHKILTQWEAVLSHRYENSQFQASNGKKSIQNLNWRDFSLKDQQGKL